MENEGEDNQQLLDFIDGEILNLTLKKWFILVEENNSRQNHPLQYKTPTANYLIKVLNYFGSLSGFQPLQTLRQENNFPLSAQQFLDLVKLLTDFRNYENVSLKIKPNEKQNPFNARSAISIGFPSFEIMIIEKFINNSSFFVFGFSFHGLNDAITCTCCQNMAYQICYLKTLYLNLKTFLEKIFL